MTSRASDGEELEGAEGRGRGRWKVSSESEEGGTYHNGKPAKELYKEDAKVGDAEERGAERVRMELGETCHNDKPGRSDGDGG